MRPGLTNIVYVRKGKKLLSMDGFELEISCVGNDRTANSAGTVQCDQMTVLFIQYLAIVNNEMCPKA